MEKPKEPLKKTEPENHDDIDKIMNEIHMAEASPESRLAIRKPYTFGTRILKREAEPEAATPARIKRL